MLKSLLTSFVAQQELILELIHQDLRRINYGSGLGLLWVVANPLLHAPVYVGVLRVVFPVRLGIGIDHWAYTRYVISGFMVWHVIVATLTAAPMLFLARVHLLKYVPYPIEMVPLASVAQALLGGTVLFGVYLVLALFAG